jgi:hypothetical protein
VPRTFAACSMERKLEIGARQERGDQHYLTSPAFSIGSPDALSTAHEDEQHFKRKRRKLSPFPVSDCASEFSKVLSTAAVSQALTYRNLSNTTSDRTIKSSNESEVVKEKASFFGSMHSAFVKEWKTESPATMCAADEPTTQQLARMENLAASEAAKNNYIHSCTEKDVIMGRGGTSRHHPGNQWYLSAKRSLQKEYFAAYTREEKTKISNWLVDSTYARGGRFLERVAGSWYLEVDKEQAQRKVSQALREDLKEQLVLVVGRHKGRAESSTHSVIERCAWQRYHYGDYQDM